MASTEHHGAGDAAFTLRVLALVFALVPIVGDFVAVPSTLGAVVLGVIGIDCAERGLATNPNMAIASNSARRVFGVHHTSDVAAMGTFR